MIEKLRAVDPEERIRIITELYEKNRAFLQKRSPEVIAHVDAVNCPYGITLTEKFLEIYNETTGELAHPPGKLDTFCEVLGDWTHNAWVDLTNFRVNCTAKFPVHYKALQRIEQALIAKFPEYPAMLAQKRINLKELGNGKRFSPPIIFLGIFHALHIDFHLSRTETSRILLVEPDAKRFELSMYFLDYEQLYDRIAQVYLSIGDNVQTNAILNFFNGYYVCSSTWVRILPGYEHQSMPYFIDTFELKQSSFSNIFFPVDTELTGIAHALKNIQAKLPLVTSKKPLTKNCRICIVASGPSLNNDLRWLKKNQNKVIIFAVHSAVLPLRNSGIMPDFQFSLETERDADLVNKLQLEKTKPLIAYIKTCEEFIHAVDETLLCPVSNVAMPVQKLVELESAMPSTTNLAFSFACFCNPSSIILFGCDMGQPVEGPSHVKGTIYDSRESHSQVQTIYSKMDKGLVGANFGKEKLIKTNPFLTNTRFSLERLISSLETDIEIINCSDGAKIKGAKAVRSNKLKIKEPYSKAVDVNKIRSFFQEAEEGVNWARYDEEGEVVWQKFKTSFLEKLSAAPKDWGGMSKVLDIALPKTLAEIIYSSEDNRILVFERLIVDLMTLMYCPIILNDSLERAQDIFDTGVGLLKEALDEVHWPE